MLSALHFTEEVGFSLPLEVSAINREIYLHLKPRVDIHPSVNFRKACSLVGPSSDVMQGIFKHRRVIGAVIPDSFSRWSELPLTHMEFLTVHCVPRELPLLQPPAILQDHQLEKLFVLCEEDTDWIPAFLFQLQAKNIEIEIPSTFDSRVLDDLVSSVKAETVEIYCEGQQLDFNGSSPYLKTIVIHDAMKLIPLHVPAQIQINNHGSRS